MFNLILPASLYDGTKVGSFGSEISNSSCRSGLSESGKYSYKEEYLICQIWKRHKLVGNSNEI